MYAECGGIGDVDWGRCCICGDVRVTIGIVGVRPKEEEEGEGVGMGEGEGTGLVCERPGALCEGEPRLRVPGGLAGGVSSESRERTVTSCRKGILSTAFPPQRSPS